MSDKKTRTMDTDCATCPEATPDAAAAKPRFLPSGITADGYQGTRVRRWEKYQRDAVCQTFAHAKAKLSGEKQKRILCDVLSTCLVHPEKPRGAALLFRPGASGAKRIAREVALPEVVKAIETCMEISNCQAKA